MNKINLYRVCAPVMWSLMLSAVAVAAPVAPTEASDVPDQSATSAINRATERSGPAESGGSSRAVDLLIELQSKTAGLDFNERARENGNLARPVATAGTGAVPAVGSVSATQNAAGLFGSGAVPMPVAKETASRDSDWRPSVRNTSSSTNPQEDAAGGGRLTLPREIIQWVRDNRGMMVGGALLVLVLLWGTSVAVSQRRR